MWHFAEPPPPPPPSVTYYLNDPLEVAGIIRSFAIIGFDYLQTRKQGKTTNNEGKNTVLV